MINPGFKYVFVSAVCQVPLTLTSRALDAHQDAALPHCPSAVAVCALSFSEIVIFMF